MDFNLQRALVALDRGVVRGPPPEAVFVLNDVRMDLKERMLRIEARERLAPLEAYARGGGGEWARLQQQQAHDGATLVDDALQRFGPRAASVASPECARPRHELQVTGGNPTQQQQQQACDSVALVGDAQQRFGPWASPESVRPRHQIQANGGNPAPQQVDRHPSVEQELKLLSKHCEEQADRERRLEQKVDRLQQQVSLVAGKQAEHPASLLLPRDAAHAAPAIRMSPPVPLSATGRAAALGVASSRLDESRRHFYSAVSALDRPTVRFDTGGGGVHHPTDRVSLSPQSRDISPNPTSGRSRVHDADHFADVTEQLVRYGVIPHFPAALHAPPDASFAQRTLPLGSPAPPEAPAEPDKGCGQSPKAAATRAQGAGSVAASSSAPTQRTRDKAAAAAAARAQQGSAATSAGTEREARRPAPPLSPVAASVRTVATPPMDSPKYRSPTPLPLPLPPCAQTGAGEGPAAKPPESDPGPTSSRGTDSKRAHRTRRPSGSRPASEASGSKPDRKQARAAAKGAAGSAPVSSPPAEGGRLGGRSGCAGVGSKRGRSASEKAPARGLALQLLQQGQQPADALPLHARPSRKTYGWSRKEVAQLLVSVKAPTCARTRSWLSSSRSASARSSRCCATSTAPWLRWRRWRCFENESRQPWAADLCTQLREMATELETTSSMGSKS
eukprot:gene17034-26134_t